MKKLNTLRRRDIAIQAAKTAGDFLWRNFGRTIKIKEKGHYQLVTNIDLEAEKIIKDLIIENFPQDNIISEENSLKKDSECSWIIDPLDGTHNFIHNIDIFGVSIAFAFKEKVILGVIYMPTDKELYVALRGEGAYKNGKRIYVSDRDINQATLIFDSSIRYQKKKILKDLEILCEAVFNIRMFGSTVRSLSFIAEGKAEIEVEYNDKIWDFAAGLILVEEAGGRATDLKGNPWNIYTKGYIASNQKVWEKILTLKIGNIHRNSY
ncbi:MAG: inositol monophosphatase [Candidatus Omnitrophica bacterium]|nr:inositol monophosphatase [Candidatus Omnitrophota bacterium]